MAQASEASVEAIRAQSEAMLRPYINVEPFIRPHTPFLYMRIKNTGRTSAENLQLSLDRDFFQFGKTDRPEKNLRNLSAFTAPIDSFPPGTELIFAGNLGYFSARILSKMLLLCNSRSRPNTSFLKKKLKK
jgi:hypothetical protein